MLLQRLRGSQTMDPTHPERLYRPHLQTKTVKWIKPRTMSLSRCPSSHVLNAHYNSTYICTAVHRRCQALHYKILLTTFLLFECTFMLRLRLNVINLRLKSNHSIISCCRTERVVKFINFSFAYVRSVDIFVNAAKVIFCNIENS